MQIYGPSHVHGAQPLNAPHSTRGVRETTPDAPAVTQDRLDISEAGQIAARLADVPDIRESRVEELRAAIRSGTYETEARLSAAVDRLLDEIA